MVLYESRDTICEHMVQQHKKHRIRNPKGSVSKHGSQCQLDCFRKILQDTQYGVVSSNSYDTDILRSKMYSLYCAVYPKGERSVLVLLYCTRVGIQKPWNASHRPRSCVFSHWILFPNAKVSVLDLSTKLYSTVYGSAFLVRTYRRREYPLSVYRVSSTKRSKKGMLPNVVELSNGIRSVSST